MDANATSKVVEEEVHEGHDLTLYADGCVAIEHSQFQMDSSLPHIMLPPALARALRDFLNRPDIAAQLD